MRKLIAIVSVISWTGFWAFGYLALASDPSDGQRPLIAIALAAVAFLTGMFTYIKLRRDMPTEWKRATQSEAA